MSQISQHDLMILLDDALEQDMRPVCRVYAAMERAGLVTRASNTHSWTPEQYARALWRNGTAGKPGKNWLLRARHARRHHQSP